jgi:hypothetical protein
MKDEQSVEGGCLCGAIRYRISGSPFAAEYCHCSICQKTTGSAFANWMDFKQEQLTWSAGKPHEYRSSENVRRGFCPECGSTLSFRDTRYPGYATLTIASLDDPNQVRPTRHIYTDSQLKWLVINDDCERFPGDPE